MVIARLGDDGVDDMEIELALRGLDLVPLHRHEQGIGVAGHKLRPQRRQEGRVRRRRIAQLAAQDQVRLAVDDKLLRRTLCRQTGQGRGVGCCAQSPGGEDRQEGLAKDGHGGAPIDRGPV